MYSTDEIAPPLDIFFGGTDDLTNKKFAYINNTYCVTFDRLLNTKDTYDYAFILV